MRKGISNIRRVDAAVSVFAPAKINLALKVTGRRADGYHLLESLVVFAHDLGDRIVATAADRLTLTVTGPHAANVPTGEENLVLRAAHALADARNTKPLAALTLEKHLPHGAGIGGGSADAAAAIKALAALWQVPPLSAAEALRLGADVPVCLCAPQPALMYGIGEDCRPLSGLPEFWLVLVNPGVVLSTPEVFGVFDRHHAGQITGLDPWPDAQCFDNVLDWLSRQGNDLTRYAEEMTEKISEILSGFNAMDVIEYSNMSGSGSTCWGLVRTREDAIAAAAGMRQKFPGYWVKTARISS